MGFINITFIVIHIFIVDANSALICYKIVDLYESNHCFIDSLSQCLKNTDEVVPDKNLINAENTYRLWKILEKMDCVVNQMIGNKDDPDTCEYGYAIYFLTGGVFFNVFDYYLKSMRQSPEKFNSGLHELNGEFYRMLFDWVKIYDDFGEIMVKMPFDVPSDLSEEEKLEYKELVRGKIEQGDDFRTPQVCRMCDTIISEYHLSGVYIDSIYEFCRSSGYLRHPDKLKKR